METERKLTGSSNGYYKVYVKLPTSPGIKPYTAECNDIIESLEMTPAEANVFKATWRKAAARLGNGKPGNTDLYDAEKVVFFGKRQVVHARYHLENQPEENPFDSI